MARSPLVPDLSQSLNLALQTFGTPEVREAREIEREARETETARKTETSEIIQSLPGAKKGKRETSLLRLVELAGPEVANTIRSVLESDDAEQLEVLRAETEKGSRQAAFVARQPTFAAKQNAISELAREAIAAGSPPDKFIELLDLSEPELDLRLQKMKIMGQDLKTVLETPEGPTPLTAIAKAREDLKNKLITQDDFDTLNATPVKFQTDVGKLLGDQKLVNEMFGPDSPQAQAFAEAIKLGQKGEEPKLSDVKGIRGEFTKLSGDFIKLRDAIGKVRLGAENPSAAGDIAMIFNFMKINDPGSTVREGEFATAQNAAGVPERIRAQYNQIVSGERLTVNQRQDFLDTSVLLFNAQKEKQIQLEESFGGIADRAGINRDDVVIDFIGDKRALGAEDIVSPEVTIQEGTTATNATTGEQIIFRDGQWQPQ